METRKLWKKILWTINIENGTGKIQKLMTVRIAQDLGLKKIVNFSQKLGIYENPSELLSISLGSAETTLLKLTSHTLHLVNGGKLVKPIMIDRIQDSEGNTILNNETRKCTNCEQISHLTILSKIRGQV